jgi:hypothetical protein
MNQIVDVTSSHFATGSWSPEEFDLVIVMAGYSQRSQTIASEVGLRAARGILLYFEEGVDAPERNKRGNRDTLSSYLRQCTKQYDEVSLSVGSYEREILRVLPRVADALRASGGSNRVAIDITALPRYYFSTLLVQMFLAGLLNDVTVYYAEAHYVQAEEVESFVGSPWRLLAVRGAYGLTDPTLKRGYLLSVGFEYTKVNRLISNHAPDRVWVLEADPGFDEAYTQYGREAVKKVLAFAGSAAAGYCLGQTTANAGDVTSALSVVRELLFDDLMTDPATRWTAVPCGPKPHGLVFTILAMENRELTLTCPSPDYYYTRETVSNGRSWVYTISDRTSVL